MFDTSHKNRHFVKKGSAAGSDLLYIYTHIYIYIYIYIYITLNAVG